MASRADHDLLEQWNRQRNNKDWDTYLWRIGDPPTHICEANERCLREAEEGEGKEQGRGMGSGRERERGRERLEDDNNTKGGRLRQTGFMSWHPSKGIIHLEDNSSGNESVDSDVEEVVLSLGNAAFGRWYQSAPVRSRSSLVPVNPTRIFMSGRRSERACRPSGTPWTECTSNGSRCRKVGMNPIVDSTAPRPSKTLTSHLSWSRTPLHHSLGLPPATPKGAAAPSSFAVASFSPDGGGSNSDS
jgi:hypothetical protein